MSLKDYWIGDRVFITDLHKIGSFEGKDDQGMAIVKIEGESLKVKPANIRPASEIKSASPALRALERELAEKPKANFKLTGNKIDLHIDKLAPHLESADASRILSHQLEACKQFVQSSIESKQGVIQIIHGKGKGVLKSEVIELLKHNKGVRLYVEANQGGALDVWLI